ncbi:MAG TPA: hypothetical protein VI757_13905 [Bacteroidia bacterium]|nr:hypothetical protein [Bacteroidia bacterium]
MKKIKRITFRKHQVIELAGKYYVNAFNKVKLDLFKIHHGSLFIICNNVKYYEVERGLLVKLGFKLERKKRNKIKSEKLNDLGAKVIRLIPENKIPVFLSSVINDFGKVNYN